KRFRHRFSTRFSMSQWANEPILIAQSLNHPIVRWPTAQLISHDDEPDRLREQNDRHAMDVEPQVADADRNHDERRNNPAIGRDTSPDSSVAQGGGRLESERT